MKETGGELRPMHLIMMIKSVKHLGFQNCSAHRADLEVRDQRTARKLRVAKITEISHSFEPISVQRCPSLLLQVLAAHMTAENDVFENIDFSGV